MNALIGIIKVLCLAAFAAVTLGWGACGAVGLTFSLAERSGNFEILALSLAGFALMVLFGWWTRKLFFAFFPKTSGDGRGGSGFEA